MKRKKKATTDSNGYYEIPPINTYGHQETVRIYAELPGYSFDPPTEYSWSYSGYGSTVEQDFIAVKK